MTAEFRITRLVVSMCGNLPESRAVGAAAQLARQLGIELSGLLLEDDTIATLRSLPFAREFAPVSQRWLNLDKDHLGNERERVRRLAQRLMEDAAGREGLTCSLEFGTGSLASGLARASQSDVMALVAPGRAGEAMMLPFSELVLSVLKLRAHTLILPPLGVKADGPILALATSAQDNTIGVAKSLVRAADSPLIVLVAAENIAEIEAQISGWQARVLPLISTDLDQVELTIARLNPRMVIIGRTPASGIDISFWFRLATNNSVATLMLDE